MGIEETLAQVESSTGRREQELMELLRIPSVSTDPERTGDVRRAAEWVRDALSRAGCEASIEETAGHPVVFGERRISDDLPAVLVYGHYDVQPADEHADGWSRPPFEPAINGGNVYARGASDDKGQMLCWVHAAQAWQEAGGAPVNLKFVIEGEEEIGSPHLGAWIEQNRERLAADVVAVSDMDQLAPGRPALTYGLRGLLYVELRVYGPAEDQHSGLHGGAVMNPVTALCRVVAGLHDAEGRITVDGFYDDVRPLEGWERDMFRELAPDEDAYAKELGVGELFGEAGYTAFEHTCARPTLELNGIFGGFQGAGAKTVLPAYAGAKISMRLVPDQDPMKILEGLRATIAARMPKGVRWDLGAPGPGFTATGDARRAPLAAVHEAAKAVLVERTSRFAQAATDAFTRGFGAEPVWVRSGGSIPVVLLFKELLGLDAVLMGYGLPDDSKHGPDEKMCVADFHRGCRTSAIFMDAVAGIPTGS
jgi:acetylornithine deacetylase/succinyl-diaminopimelate desuccinylase-like protein